MKLVLTPLVKLETLRIEQVSHEVDVLVLMLAESNSCLGVLSCQDVEAVTATRLTIIHKQRHDDISSIHFPISDILRQVAGRIAIPLNPVPG